MIKAYKTEVKLTKNQKGKLVQDIGNCRKVYNLMLHTNKERHDREEGFIGGFDFSKHLNNELIKQHPYLKLTSSKAIKQAIMHCDKAFKMFFKRGSGFPRFKSKYKSSTGVYLPRNNPKDIIVERHRVKCPTYGFLRLKEKGYLPTDNVTYKSVTLTLDKAGRAFVSLLVDTGKSENNTYQHLTCGIGVDLGVKEFATVSDGRVFKNINKSSKVKSLERLLKKVNQQVSRKKKGSHNRYKTLLRKNKIEKRLNNIRKDYYRKVAISLVKAKPEFIAIEDLCVRSMLKNKHLSEKIRKSNFYSFRIFLESKCQEFNIPLRYVDRYFPSSKTCNSCGKIKTNLPLSERTFSCFCGYEIDRDLNAAYNIRDFSK